MQRVIRRRKRASPKPQASRDDRAFSNHAGWIDELIAAHRPGFSLARPFYNDSLIFVRDMERVFQQQWLLVGHVSQLCHLGDYFLFTIGDESIILVRAKDGEVHALFNVCRHRGSRVCLEPHGNKRTLVCPIMPGRTPRMGRCCPLRQCPPDLMLWNSICADATCGFSKA